MTTDRCSVCDSTLNAGARFCGKCGRPVPQQGACPSCASPLEPDAAFCHTCGHRSHRVSQDPRAPSSPTRRPDPYSCASPVYGDRYGGVGQFGDDLSLFGYFVKCMKNYFKLGGRARRKEFWGFYLFSNLATLAWYILLGIATVIAAAAMDFDIEKLLPFLGCVLLLAIFAPLAMMPPAIAVYVRRMHDQGKSGWNILWVLLPIAGPIVYIVFACLEGQRGENQYGPDPKGR